MRKLERLLAGFVALMLCTAAALLGDVIPRSFARLVFLSLLAFATLVALVRFRKKFLISVSAVCLMLLLGEAARLLLRREPPPTSDVPVILPSAELERQTETKEAVTDDPTIRYYQSRSYRRRDPELGRATIPGAVVQVTKRSGDGKIKIFENVTYSLDGKGRRRCETCPPIPWPAERHAIFFGDSFTFGMGVPADKTMPFRFQAISEGRFRAYNYAVEGYGSGQMHVQLGRDSLFEDVREPEGIAVYSFIPAHMARSVAIHSLKDSADYASYPLFALSEEGELFRPYRAEAGKPAPTGAAMDSAGGPPPDQEPQADASYQPVATFSDEAYRIVAKLIIESRDMYSKRFQGQFYVILWPRHMALAKGNLNVLVDSLEAAGIEVVRPPAMQPAKDSYIHPVDSHPSAAEYSHVAEYLYGIVTKVSAR